MKNKLNLQLLLEAHAAYWNENRQIITDKEYDEQIELLREQDPEHWLLNSVGGSAGEIKHEKPMLSLCKAYSYEEIYKWMINVSRDEQEKFVVQYKFDGLAGCIFNGKVLTRGDGKHGQDISHNTKNLRIIDNGQEKGIFRFISEHQNERILGEMVVSNEKFEQYKKIEKFEEYKHPRNFVAGFLNRKKNKDKDIVIDFLIYESSPSLSFEKKEFSKDKFERILSWFLKNQQYPADGLVFKLEDQSYSEKLGCTSHHPRGQIAFKFSGEIKESKIRRIIWQTGENKLTPVAIIRPVTINGVEIRRVTLHNYSNVLKMKAGKGSNIKIERSGDVIPHILSCEHGEMKIPRLCPDCSALLKETEVDLYCPNPDCPEKKFQRILKGIETLKIKFVGSEILRKIVQQYDLRDIGDFLELNENQLKGCLPGDLQSEKIARNILIARQNSSLETILASMRIVGMGESSWREIVAEYDPQQVFEEPALIESIPGNSIKKSKRLSRWLKANKERALHILSLFDLTCKNNSKSEKGGICFTGKMPEKRSFYEQLAREKGYDPEETVSERTKILVSNDLSSNSGKMKKALKKGIKIITLKEWLNEQA